MTDEFTEMDVLALGQYAGDYPNDGAAAAELMRRALNTNPLVKGVERRWENQIVFVQPANGPSLKEFGEDYDYDVQHVVIAEKTQKALPDYEESEGDITVTLRVHGIREDYEGRARPDYSRDGTQYKGKVPEPRPGS